ncbi:MAG: hypothetical protein LBC83_00915 [Oscillospiraceae bacterium]|jgi:hypothetical protein|nr:hypothetical protein [Oscillospiraceae bacterium]
MKWATGIRRAFAALLAVALLASGLAISAAAANEKVYYILQTSDSTPEIGSIIEVTVKLRATHSGGNMNIPLLRFNLHYDPNFYEIMGDAGAGQKLNATYTDVSTGATGSSYERLNGMDLGGEGNFEIRNATGDEGVNPNDGTGNGLNVVRMQWIAPIVQDGGVSKLGTLTPGNSAEGLAVLLLRFRVKETAPLTGAAGRIAIYKNYSGQDMPFYFYHCPNPEVTSTEGYVDYTPTGSGAPACIDVAQALLSLKPRPHAPSLQIKPGAQEKLQLLEGRPYQGIIYGFAEEMTEQGTATRWIDPQYASQDSWNYAAQIDGFLQATNYGVLSVSNAGKPEHKHDYGTGTKATLYDSSKTIPNGEYYFVVFGDVDGNFIVNLDDYVELKAMLAGNRPQKYTGGNDAYESPYRVAANVADPGDAVLGQADLQRLYQVALGMQPITAITQSPAALPPV